MLQNRHLLAAMALLLTGMLVPTPGLTANVTQLHVHLEIRSACLIRNDPGSTRAPRVSCSHGQPAYAISRVPAHGHLQPTASSIAVRDGATDGAPKVWMVTF